MRNLPGLNDDAISRQQSIQSRCFHPSGSFTEFEMEEIEQSIPERFEKQVVKYPGRLAVRSRTHEFTYDELNETANRIAGAILARRGEGEEPIALMLEHGALPIVMILAILKAGKIYVSLEPSVPRSRNSYILENSGAGLIVTNSKNLPLAEDLTKNQDQLLNIDALDPGLSSENPTLSISPDAIAYIIYTSGSTGHPKGVFQNHRNALYDIMGRVNAYHICPDDRLSLLTSSSFGGSLRKIFPAILTGASVHTLNVKEEGVGDMPDWLIRERMTIHGGRAVFRDFLDTLTGEERFPDIRILTLGGDTIYRRDIESMRKFAEPDCIIIVGLGTTEAGTVTNYFIDEDMEITDATVPVGYQFDDRKVMILDDDGREAGPNQIGQIAIKSRYLTLGYWRRPDLTQARFLPDPDGGDERTYLTGDMGRMLPDGCFIHMGREDFQVKIRGYRVEIAETEMALLDHPAVKKAIVVAREDRPGDKRLVAYLTIERKPAPTVSELRSFLGETLPEYMVPSTFVMLEDMPLTVTGKINRNALPAPGTDRPRLDNPFVAPRTPVEKSLAEIWAHVLSLDEVGIQDNFLELGGNSLLATQIASRIIEKFRVKMPLNLLFQSPNVADMAEAILREQVEDTDQKDVDRMLKELETLSDEEAKQLLDEQKREV